MDGGANLKKNCSGEANNMRFRNRSEAGQMLARALEQYKDRPDVLVLALPRGGVPVGHEVATALNVLLDVFIVRKLGVPGHEELAMGAIASGNIRSLNRSVIHELNIPQSAIDRVATREGEELRRRETLYRDERPLPSFPGRTVILVDDGLATGSTMRAAIAALHQQKPKKIVVAVPTAPIDTCDELKREADEVICAVTPDPFYAVGLWYEEFEQTSDAEVTELLRRAA
jgi:putative phosphoribosyl transferase